MASGMQKPVYDRDGVPVTQPPHLEGDKKLATEILPGPPSLQVVQQMAIAHRRDPKKPAVSYLPVSDPGTTYGGHTVSAMTAIEIDGPRRKRARVDKGSARDRAQRASARNVNVAPSVSSDVTMGPGRALSSPPPLQDSDAMSVQMETDPPYLSRSNSVQYMDVGDDGESASAATRGPKKDKGKGKEKEKVVLRVKEEPVTLVVPPPVDPSPSTHNEDHCSACRSLGALLYCDGCPRAFHFWCLNPPMEPSDVPEGDTRWFCPSCSLRQNPPPNPAPSVLAPMIYQVQTSIPMEYQLPDDIRGFFKDVATNVRGGYLDASEAKQPRLNRHGQLEDRDPYRLKDRNGAPVLCFSCGSSALPDDAAAASPAVKQARKSSSTTSMPGAWKSIVSCDYCDLHWHLDCLDPPLPSMPSFGKKWMCPNHAEHVLQPKRRIPKHNAPPIEVGRLNQWNNGNIEIIQSEPVSAVPKVAVDEVMINGRRYRVPEKVVVLDFWNKVKNNHGHRRRDFDIRSAASSPLTSLSELDMDDIPFSASQSVQHDEDDLRIAELLCGLRVTAAQSSEAPSSPRLLASSESSIASSADSSIKRRKTGERKRGRPNISNYANGTLKMEPDDTDYIPSAGPVKGARGSKSQDGNAGETERSARPRRSGRVPQPRKRSPVPSRVTSVDSTTATPDPTPSPAEKTNSHSTSPTSAPVPTAIPAHALAPASSTSNKDAPQSNPTQSQSLKIRLPGLNSLSISSAAGRPAHSVPSSQLTVNDLTSRTESRKGQGNEARSRRASRRRTSTVASAASTQSPSKLAGKNIAV
ncbi:hypothetical protein OE88DRAFT_991469 [Heliocybe sulcata]|uniref:PHD-type domain-containing protein n=1 Tax=Heliocybe sulcata TaxID=5364 RepID=A0A5C3NN27_9AGAM|nr:hypothetical protein OE88DRAFT_991469 [Heliocybe sulcata]